MKNDAVTRYKRFVILLIVVGTIIGFLILIDLSDKKNISVGMVNAIQRESQLRTVYSSFDDIIGQTENIQFALYDMDCDGELELATSRMDDASKNFVCIYDRQEDGIHCVVQDLMCMGLAVIPGEPYIAARNIIFYDSYYILDASGDFSIIMEDVRAQTEEKVPFFGEKDDYINIIENGRRILFVENTEQERNNYLGGGIPTGDTKEGLERWLDNFVY